MAGASCARYSVLLTVILLVTSTLDAAVLQPRFPRAVGDASTVVFPRSAATPQESTSVWEAGPFAANAARAAEMVAPSTGHGYEGNHEVVLDFGKKFEDKFPEWKNKRSQTPTIIFPRMMSSESAVE